MRDDHWWYLKKVDLFKGIPDEEIMRIAQKVSERHCDEHEHLYSPHQPSNTIYLLKSGEITLYHLHKGKKFIIAVLEAGSVLGNFSTESDRESHFAEITKPAHVCTFDKDDLLEVVRAKPEVLLRLLQTMAVTMQDYEQKLKANILSAKERVLEYILSLENKRNHTLLGNFFSRSKITHDKIAAHTGLSRETVTRAIQELKREGSIEIAKGGDLHLTVNP